MCSTAWLRRPDARHVLVLSIFLDILSVSLVVPSLPRKYRALGLTGFKFGLVGSVYSATQIMGGVILGIASDRMLGRRGLLLVSFAGAAISYTLVAYAQSLTTLVASRVIVGLCKQSMTAVTALMTEMTGTGPARTAWLSRISCASTLAWAAGGAMGGYLSTISPQLPELVSVGLYALNALMVVCALPPSGPCAVALRRQADAEEVEVTRTISSTRLGERVDKTPPTPSSPPDAGAGAAVPAPPPVERLQSSFRHVLRHRAVLLVVTAQLTRLLVGRALGSLADMYELERWSLTTAEIGYMRSYKSVVVLVLQMLLLPRLTRRFSLHVLLHAFTWVKVGADLLEMLPATAISPFVPDALRAWLPGRLAEDPTLMVFAMLCIPVRSACSSAIGISQKSLFTLSVPQSEMGAALATLDVLQSCAGVVAPMVGGVLLSVFTPGHQPVVAAVSNVLLACQLLLCFPPSSWSSSAPAPAPEPSRKAVSAELELDAVKLPAAVKRTKVE